MPLTVVGERAGPFLQKLPPHPTPVYGSDLSLEALLTPGGLSPPLGVREGSRESATTPLGAIARSGQTGTLLLLCSSPRRHGPGSESRPAVAATAQSQDRKPLWEF